MIEFTIAGAPQGKARARTFYNPKMGRVSTVTPEKTANYENLVKLSFLQEKPTDYIIPEKEPLKMRIIAYYDMPKSASKKQKEYMLSGEIRPTKKPDADNVAKVICDALNGIAYKDDTQIVMLTIAKYYGTEPRVDVEIEKI